MLTLRFFFPSVSIYDIGTFFTFFQQRQVPVIAMKKIEVASILARNRRC